MKRKVVISGSASLPDDIARWKQHFEDRGYEVIGTPRLWDRTADFNEQLARVFQEYYDAVDDCDVFFLMNEEKNGIRGYVGANATAELIYVAQMNLRKKKGIKVYIANLPDERVAAHDEITSFLRAGWVSLYDPAR